MSGRRADAVAAARRQAFESLNFRSMALPVVERLHFACVVCGGTSHPGRGNRHKQERIAARVCGECWGKPAPRMSIEDEARAELREGIE